VLPVCMPESNDMSDVPGFFAGQSHAYASRLYLLD
jgi:hypothetical protein